MEPTAAVSDMSYGKNPRSGHREMLQLAEDRDRKQLNAKLPTGYGKTFGAALVYSTFKAQGRANRLLMIFPTDAQLEQFVKDGPKELSDARVTGDVRVIDIRYFGAQAVRQHRRNEAQIFAITIQALKESRGANNCHDLLGQGKWMVCVDEYHHYGIEKTWGRSALALQCEFLLAMSATPTRRQNDSAFGLPDVSVGYRDAKDEGAVKPLRGHAYRYRLDAIDDKGDVFSFTTASLFDIVGSDDPEQIEAFRIERNMRWSPKYISPLVSIPLERMQRERLRTGYPLQALVTAMCVSHARLICEQIQTMFPELAVDWVGTGRDGRTHDENESILNRFCPPKDERGIRHPTLDVLVNVGLAGEGLDSIHVAEVIFISKASLCNRNNQVVGRGSRFLLDVICNVNFDSSSDYAERGYLGEKIMDALDDSPPSEEPDDNDDDDNDWDGEWDPLPDEPKIRLFNLEFIGVDSGDPEVQRMARVAQTMGVGGIDYEGLIRNADHQDWPRIIELYQAMRAKEAKALDQKAVVEQWRQAVNLALSAVAGLIVRKSAEKVGRVEKSLPGDVKKRINTRKAYQIGPVVPDENVCRRHYQWLRQLETEILDTGIPSWLQ